MIVFSYFIILEVIIVESRPSWHDKTELGDMKIVQIQFKMRVKLLLFIVLIEMKNGIYIILLKHQQN